MLMMVALLLLLSDASEVDDVVSKRRCFSPEPRTAEPTGRRCSSKRENLASFFEEHRTAQTRGPYDLSILTLSAICLF